MNADKGERQTLTAMSWSLCYTAIEYDVPRRFPVCPGAAYWTADGQLCACREVSIAVTGIAYDM